MNTPKLIKILAILFLISANFSFADEIDDGIATFKMRICEALHLPKSSLDDTKIAFAKDNDELVRMAHGNLPEWGVGVAIPERNEVIIIRTGNFQKDRTVLNHELTHIALHRKLQDIPVPRWFDEGVAQYFSSGFTISRKAQLAWAMLWRNVLPLQSLEYVNSFNFSNAELAYAESFDAVLYLAEHNNIGTICDSIVSAHDFGDGFRRATGSSMYGFYREWVRHLSRKYLPFILLGDQRFLWTFAGTIFLIFGIFKFIRQRKHFAKLRKQAEDEHWDEPTDYIPID